MGNRAGLLAGAAGGVVACYPVGGLSMAAVAITTDQVGTKVLKSDGIAVQWMSCTAHAGRESQGGGTRTSTSSADSVASADCQGETRSGQKISITGRVTEERDGRCVKGHLAAHVGGRRVFEVSVLGDCSSMPTATRTGTGTPTGTPTATGTGPQPTVTGTVTPSTMPPSTMPPSTPPVTVTCTVTPSPAPTTSCGCTPPTMSPLSR